MQTNKMMMMNNLRRNRLSKKGVGKRGGGEKRY
jgi:hypothetical protein